MLSICFLQPPPYAYIYVLCTSTQYTYIYTPCSYTYISYIYTIYSYTGDMILTGSYQTDAAHAGFTGTVSRIYKTHGLAGFYIGIHTPYLYLYTDISYV